VHQEEFDPFSARLARDIRNSLSKAFLKSISHRESNAFRKVAADLIKHDIEPPYVEYITDRLMRYEETLSIIIREDINDVMRQAELLWQQKLYFEMHELLEEIWKESFGPRKKALQGLIRAAGTQIHASQGRFKAAVSMAQKAIADLAENKAAIADFHCIDLLLEELNKTVVDADRLSDQAD
jgi:predicted metal-dependent hydrolase